MASRLTRCASVSKVAQVPSGAVPLRTWRLKAASTSARFMCKHHHGQSRRRTRFSLRWSAPQRVVAVKPSSQRSGARDGAWSLGLGQPRNRVAASDPVALGIARLRVALRFAGGTARLRVALAVGDRLRPGPEPDDVGLLGAPGCESGATPNGGDIAGARFSDLRGVAGSRGHLKTVGG